jgi:hypothetical protein
VIKTTIGTANPANDDFFMPSTYNPIYLKPRPSSQFTIYIHTLSGVLTDLENEYMILSKKKIPLKRSKTL